MLHPPLFHCHFCYPMSQWISKHFHCNHPGKAGRGSQVFKYNPSMCILFLLHHVMSFLFFSFSHLNWNLLSQTKDFFLSVPQRKHLSFEEVEKTTGWLNSRGKSQSFLFYLVTPLSCLLVEGPTGCLSYLLYILQQHAMFSAGFRAPLCCMLYQQLKDSDLVLRKRKKSYQTTSNHHKRLDGRHKWPDSWGKKMPRSPFTTNFSAPYLHLRCLLLASCHFSSW